MARFLICERSCWLATAMPVGYVRDAHGGVRRVDVLAAGARRAIRVDAAFAFVDLNVDVVVDHRVHPHRRKAGVAARVGIVRRDAHQAMHARFRLQPAVGVLALDLDGDGFDAGLFAGALLQRCHLVAALLGPAHVHARQHRGPILAFRAAGTGVHLEVGVVAVRLARQQSLDAAPLRLVVEFAQRGFAFADRSVVVLRFAELDERYAVVEAALQIAIGIDRALELLALAHDLLRRLGIIPEARILRALVQLGETLLCCIPVKDASAGDLGPP